MGSSPGAIRNSSWPDAAFIAGRRILPCEAAGRKGKAWVQRTLIRNRGKSSAAGAREPTAWTVRSANRRKPTPSARLDQPASGVSVRHLPLVLVLVLLARARAGISRSRRDGGGSAAPQHGEPATLDGLLSGRPEPTDPLTIFQGEAPKPRVFAEPVLGFEARRRACPRPAPGSATRSSSTSTATVAPTWWRATAREDGYQSALTAAGSRSSGAPHDGAQEGPACRATPVRAGRGGRPERRRHPRPHRVRAHGLRCAST